MPPFVLNIEINERSIRLIAQSLPRGMDHGNSAGSALVLALLRPHLYTNNAVPLRLFGYPPPRALLNWDRNPHSGAGPDNARTNIVEALCAHWWGIWRTNIVGHVEANLALQALQEAWHLMRIKVDLALRNRRYQPYRPNAHQVFMAALMVEEDAVMPGAPQAMA